MSNPQPLRPQKLPKKNWTNQEGFLRVQQSGALRGNNLGTSQTFDFWAMSEKLLVSWRNNFSGVVNTAIHMSREKLWDKRVFFPKKNFNCLFWFLMKKFRIYGRRVSKTNSTWPEELFGKTLFGGRYDFTSFDGFSEENLICNKNSRFVSKAFYASSGTF